MCDLVKVCDLPATLVVLLVRIDSSLYSCDKKLASIRHFDQNSSPMKFGSKQGCGRSDIFVEAIRIILDFF